MKTVFLFISNTLARIGSSIFAGSLVSCLILGRLEPLHFWLMLTGIVLTTFGIPLIKVRLAGK